MAPGRGLQLSSEFCRTSGYYTLLECQAGDLYGLKNTVFFLSEHLPALKFLGVGDKVYKPETSETQERMILYYFLAEEGESSIS